MKFCNRCKKDKACDEFYTDSSTADLLTFYCRDCKRELSRLNYARHNAKNSWAETIELRLDIIEKKLHIT